MRGESTSLNVFTYVILVIHVSNINPPTIPSNDSVRPGRGKYIRKRSAFQEVVSSEKIRVLYKKEEKASHDYSSRSLSVYPLEYHAHFAT